MLAAAQSAPLPLSRLALPRAERAHAPAARKVPSGRVLVACCVVLAHAVGLALLARLATTVPTPLPVSTVEVSLISAAAPPAPPAPAPPVKKPPTLRTPPRAVVRAAPVPDQTPAAAPTAASISAPTAPATAAPAAAAGPDTAAPAPITAARFDAAYLNNPTPAYPAVSRRLREEGQVLLRVRVTADGKAAEVELRSGSGFDRLDRAALEAVARWRFVPARQGHQDIEAWVLVPIVFKLQGN